MELGGRGFKYGRRNILAMLLSYSCSRPLILWRKLLFTFSLERNSKLTNRGLHCLLAQKWVYRSRFREPGNRDVFLFAQAKCCYIELFSPVVVRFPKKSSREPGNRDVFQFAQAKWCYVELFSPVAVCFPKKSSSGAENVKLISPQA